MKSSTAPPPKKPPEPISLSTSVKERVKAIEKPIPEIKREVNPRISAAVNLTRLLRAGRAKRDENLREIQIEGCISSDSAGRAKSDENLSELQIEGCTSSDTDAVEPTESLFLKCEEASIFDALGPGQTRPSQARVSRRGDSLAEIDRLIGENIGMSIEELADSEQLHFSRSVAGTSDSDTSENSPIEDSSSTSSVAFDCALSNRETLGTAELGEELFAVFERCHAAGMPREQIAVAINIPEKGLTKLYEKLKESTKPKKKKKIRSRVVRSVAKKEEDTNHSPKDIIRDLGLYFQVGDIRETYICKRATGILSFCIFIFSFLAFLFTGTSELSHVEVGNNIAANARPVLDQARCRPVIEPEESDLYFGFVDNGTEFLVRPPENGDVSIGERMLEGLDSHPVLAHRDANEETFCKNETLIMIPEGTLQALLGFSVSGSGKTREYTKGDLKLTARWHQGHFWLDKNDTEETRDLLARFWRARKGREPLLPRDRRISFLTFGRLRTDFDKSDVWVHNVTRKMIDKGLGREETLREWDNARTVNYFLYRCRSRLKEILEQPEEATLTGGPPARVQFCRPVKHGHVDIPLSHHFSHRPKLPGCPVCDQAKATLTPIVRTLESEKDDNSGRIEIDADYPGRIFPVSSEGSRYPLMAQSNEGHFWIIPMKLKRDENLLDAGKREMLAKGGIEPSKVDLKGDDELEALGKYIETEGGSYNSGIANRPNSHARAENCVKNGMGAMKSCSLASAAPPKDWGSLAKTLTVNMSREIGNKYIGEYKGPLFIHGETSSLKLEPKVYVPPVTSPTAVKVMFCHYNTSSNYAVVVEFYDEHLKKRRRTEVTCTAFEKGLPSNRPQYGYKRHPSEKEPLAFFIQGVLNENEEPIEVPREREVKDYEKRDIDKIEKGKARVVNKTLKEISAPEADEDWYEGFEDLCDFEKFENDYDFSQHEVYLDLGQTDAQDFDEARSPMEVSIGEQPRICRKVRPGRDYVKLTKVLKPREISQHPYSNLNWQSAYEKEKTKMFDKFGALLDQPIEASDLEEGSQIIRNFGVHTIKNFDFEPEWEPSYRLVGAGNNVMELKVDEKGTKRWAKMPSVIDRQRDAIDSATMETTRLFIHTQKIKNRRVRKDDADGAYLQAPIAREKRKSGLFAELPLCMYPENSPAFGMKRPVFPVEKSIYGTDDAGFSWDRHSHQKLEDSNFVPYYDLSQSLYDYFPEGTDLSILKTEGEIEPHLYPKDEGSVSQYVDDFLSAQEKKSKMTEKLLTSVKCKSGPDDEIPEDLGRYVGSSWEKVNAEPVDGVYKYRQQQIKYVEAAVKSAEETALVVGAKTIREADTPAMANDSKHAVDLDETVGLFAPYAPSIVCSLLYIARSTRIDILYAVCRMTRYLTCWTVRQDQWLCRCIGYLKRTSSMTLNFSICPEDFEEGGDGVFENLADADLGGDPPTKRSTSGGLGMLLGSRTRAFVFAHCKRQGQPGISTPEAETVALVVLGKKAIPLHMIAQRLLKRALKLSYRGDNSASERVVGTGVSAALAYMKRTAQLSLTWAKANLAPFLGRVPTDLNTSDIFTKPLEKEKFEHFRTEIGIW